MTITPKTAPFYTSALNSALNDLKTSNTINLNTDPNVKAQIIFTQPVYIKQNDNYLLTNPPVLSIKTNDYDLMVEVNNNTRTVSLISAKSNNTIYELSYDKLDSLQTQDDVLVNSHRYAFLTEVTIAYQILKYIPQSTTINHEKLEDITNQVQLCIARTLQHFITREQDLAQSLEKDMAEITHVINYLNSISTEIIKETNSLELQVKVNTADNTFIISINDNITINIVDPQDPNITHKVQYDYNSSVLHVINNNTNETTNAIPIFILYNNKMDTNELNALRDTYNLFDATCHAFRIMQYFHNSSTYQITDKACDIKRHVYNAINNTSK